MVEYRIEHSGLLGFENTNFAIDIVKLSKATKNRSYPNLSNCCNAPLKQVKKCGNCGATIEDARECTCKQFKLGKENISISSAHLNEIKEQLDSDKIVISEFRDLNEIPDIYFTDMLFGAKQHKKYKKEYSEYLEILQRTSKVGVGMFNFRSRPYPIMIYPYQGHLVIRCLHFFEEVDPMPSIEPVLINETKVNLLTEAMRFNVTKNPFDIGKFINTREEAEQKLIERVLKGEKLPEVEKTEVKSTQDNDEIARLQELLKKKKEMESAPKAEG